MSVSENTRKPFEKGFLDLPKLLDRESLARLSPRFALHSTFYG
ncbi:MAG TPA: hypothetical protein PLN69_05185 [bacterium]|nr:hypothetical protein [bacterium]